MFDKIRNFFSQNKRNEAYEYLISELNYYRSQYSGHHDSAETGRLQNDWSVAYDTFYRNVKGDFTKIVARSIRECDNNAHARGLINTIVSNVIGLGLRPQPQVKLKNGKPNDTLNKALLDGWDRYNDQWDSRDMFPFIENQHVILTEIIRSGSVLFNRVPGDDRDFLGMRTQLLHPLRLDSSRDINNRGYDQFQEVKHTSNGINYDKNGRPLSYWIRGVGNPVSAQNMRISFKPFGVEETIGLPWLSVALKYLWSNDQLIEDKLIASRIQSLIALFVPNSMVSKLLKNDTNSDKQLKMSAGRVYTGKPNEKPEIIQADDSIENVLSPLQKILLHAIGMTVGVSYNSFTRDSGDMSYSSMRGNSVEERRIYKYIQRYFAKDVCQKEWNEFVYRMFLYGKIPGKSIADYLKDPWAYNQCLWRPNGWDWVDPKSDAQANVQLRDANLLTYDEYYASKGQDWRKAIDQMATEQEYIKEKGLEINRGSTNAQTETGVSDTEDNRRDQ